QVRQANQKIARLVVVEGYMDVIALFEHGVTQAVATLGTATTSEHAELLFRNAPDVYFCFDGDRAGRGAAWKAVESVLPRMRDGSRPRRCRSFSSPPCPRAWPCPPSPAGRGWPSARGRCWRRFPMAPSAT